MTFLDKLREANKAATPAPWEVGCQFKEFNQGTIIRLTGDTEHPVEYPAIRLNNVDLIVLLRNATPELVEFVEAARDIIAYSKTDGKDGSDPRLSVWTQWDAKFDRMETALAALDAKAVRS